MNIIPPEVISIVVQESSTLLALVLATKSGNKLLDTVTKYVDWNLEARQVKRKVIAEAEGKVEADKIKAKGEFEKQMLIERNQAELAANLPVINEGALKRIVLIENRRQENINDVVAEAAKEMDGKEASQQPVDEDWTARFFESCQDISNEQIKTLWAKILAGEVIRPNTYSLRTLDALKNLSTQEAETFAKFVQSVFLGVNGAFALSSTKNHKFQNEEINFDYSDLMVLREADLLSPTIQGFVINPNQDETFEVLFEHGDQALIIEIPINAPSFTIEAEKLTKTGQELLPLIDVKPNYELYKIFFEQFKSKEAIYKIGKIIENSNGTDQLIVQNVTEFEFE